MHPDSVLKKASSCQHAVFKQPGGECRNVYWFEECRYCSLGACYNIHFVPAASLGLEFVIWKMIERARLLAPVLFTSSQIYHELICLQAFNKHALKVECENFCCPPWRCAEFGSFKCHFTGSEQNDKNVHGTCRSEPWKFSFSFFLFFSSSLYVGKLQNLLSADRKKCVNVPTSSEFLESSIH